MTGKGLATAAIATVLLIAAGVYASHRATIAQIEHGDCGITPTDARQEALNFAVVQASELGLTAYPKDGDLTLLEHEGTCMYTFTVVSGGRRADVIVYDNYPHTAVAVTTAANTTTS